MTMPFEQAAAWGQGGFEARGDRDEARVRRDFWRKAARVAARLPFAEDLLAAYYCAFDHATPVKVKATLVGALAYFVLPPCCSPRCGWWRGICMRSTATPRAPRSRG